MIYFSNITALSLFLSLSFIILLTGIILLVILFILFFMFHFNSITSQTDWKSILSSNSFI